MGKRHTVKKPVFKKRGFKIFLGIILFLIVLRLVLPYVVLRYANKTLASMDGYYGRVRNIDIALYRGSYQIKDIYLNKIDSVTGLQTEFFDAQVIDLSVEWRALFHGRIVGEIVMEQPRLNFKKDKVEPDEIAKDSTDFKSLVNAFMPLKVNRFEVKDGEIHFIDSTSNPVVDIKMDKTYVLAQNLSNVVDSAQKGLPSDIRATANVYRGTFVLNMKLDPFADQQKFDLDAEIKNTNLPDLNNFFQAYAKVDISKGTFGMYTELAAADGNFIGYVKPIIKDLDVLGKEDSKDSFFRKAWEAAVGTTGKVFSNWNKDQFATKIPLEGKLSDPDAKIWATIYQVLKNAFISALQPSIDYEIDIASVNKVEPEKKNIFQKIFGGKGDKKEEEKVKKKTGNQPQEAEKK